MPKLKVSQRTAFYKLKKTTVTDTSDELIVLSLHLPEAESLAKN